MEQNRVTNDDKAQELSESLGDMELPAGFEFSAQYGRMRFKTNMVIDFCDAGHDISASPNVEGSFLFVMGVAHTRDEAVDDLLESLAERYHSFCNMNKLSHIETVYRDRLGDLFSLNQ